MNAEERASLAISGDAEPEDLMRPLKWGELHAAIVRAIRSAEIAAHNAAIERAMEVAQEHIESQCSGMKGRTAAIRQTRAMRIGAASIKCKIADLKLSEDA